MFNRKLKARVEELEIDIAMLTNVCDLLAEEMGKEIDNCECCGDLCLVDIKE